MKKKSGIVMAEALMAVAALAAGAVTLGTIQNNAVASMHVSRDYLIAQGLVGEALEVVKAMRETNALSYPDDRTCWLMLDAGAGASDCSSADQAAVGRYYLIDDRTGGRWTLVDSGNNVGPHANGDASVQNKYRMYLENGMYVQSPVPLSNPVKYYRSLTFSAAGDDTASVEATILWQEGQKVRTITRKMTLGNSL